MNPKILQINFTVSQSRTELEEAWLPGAQPIADTPGLRWKIWLTNDTRREAGGIYLFDDEASLQAYLDGPIVTEIKNDPSLSNLSMKQFDVMEEHTGITRGPVREGAHV
jgi:hypothetical protein